MPLFQNCLNGPALLNKVAARAKNRKILKQHLLGQWPDFKIISTKIAKIVLLS